MRQFVFTFLVSWHILQKKKNILMNNKMKLPLLPLSLLFRWLKAAPWKHTIPFRSSWMRRVTSNRPWAQPIGSASSQRFTALTPTRGRRHRPPRSPHCQRKQKMKSMTRDSNWPAANTHAHTHLQGQTNSCLKTNDLGFISEARLTRP